MIALQVLLSTACFPCPFTHGSPSSVVQVTRAAVLVACADWKTQQDAESEASTRSRADEAQLAAAREALAIAADAREAGDLGPAREFLDQALDALSGMTSPLGMEAGGVLELRLAAEREFRFFATDAMRSGDIDGARGFVRKIVEAVRGLESVDSVEVRGAWDALDVMTESLGMLETQLTVREWIVQASERALPADHGDTLEAQHNLAVTRERLGHYEEALELFEVVHEARKRLLHPDHLLLLRTKLSLAITLQGVGQLERALEFFEHVYAARKRLLPPDSRELLTAELNLAATLSPVYS